VFENYIISININKAPNATKHPKCPKHRKSKSQ
jgi:hypothetical protein